LWYLLVPLVLAVFARGIMLATRSFTFTDIAGSSAALRPAEQAAPPRHGERHTELDQLLAGCPEVDTRKSACVRGAATCPSIIRSG
jgi:hypothetical protein